MSIPAVFLGSHRASFLFLLSMCLSSFLFCILRVAFISSRISESVYLVAFLIPYLDPMTVFITTTSSVFLFLSIGSSVCSYSSEKSTVLILLIRNSMLTMFCIIDSFVSLVDLSLRVSSSLWMSVDVLSHKG